MATTTATRRLAAILAADVVGYSRLMGADEEGTHERLKAHLRELVDPKIREHHGRIVVRALPSSCAPKKEAPKERSNRRPSRPEPRFRIHLAPPTSRANSEFSESQLPATGLPS